MREAGVGATQLVRDAGHLLGQALDVRLVDDGVRPGHERPADRCGVEPVVDHHGVRYGGPGVAVVRRGRAPDGVSLVVHLMAVHGGTEVQLTLCLLYTSPSPRDGLLSRMPSSA